MPVQIKQGQALASLSLTPLIDVVFLLLIFFLVASRFAQEERELEVELPAATSAMPMTIEAKEIVVNIDASGIYYVDGSRLTADGLTDVLRRAIINNPVNQSVIIRGDRRSALQYAITVMDLCNKAGVRDYTLTTEGDE